MIVGIDPANIVSLIAKLCKLCQHISVPKVFRLTEELGYVVLRIGKPTLFRQAMDILDKDNESNESYPDKRFCNLAQKHFWFLKTFLVKNARSKRVVLSRRISAIRGLSGIPDHRVVSPMSNLLLNDPDEKIRAAAVQGLAQLEFPDEVRDIFLYVLNCHNLPLVVRQQVIVELKAFRDSTTLMKLCPLLKHDNYSVRRNVMDTIDEITSFMLIRETRAIPYIEERLLKDKDSHVLGLAVVILQRIDGPDGKSALSNAYGRFCSKGPLSCFPEIESKISAAISKM